MSKKKIKWTDAHRREALRRTYEIAAEFVAAESARRAAYLVIDAHSYAAIEQDWREDLADTRGPAFDAARIDREVQRVHALATGRLVRETLWQSRGGAWFATREEAIEHGRGRRDMDHVLRHTRIRRHA